MKDFVVDIRDVLNARKTVNRNLKPTQLVRYEGLSRLIGADIYVKHENHHPTASRKVRGAVNVAWELRRNGVTELVTAASGCFGLALAYAARMFDMKARIIAPKDTSPFVIQQIKDMGAQVSVSGASQTEALRIAKGVEDRTDFYFVHPADELALINGSATACLEVLEELPNVDVMICSVGFGTSVASTVAVTHSLSPQTKVIGVQAESSPAAWQSWRSGNVEMAPNETFAKGFAVEQAYSLPFSIYAHHLADFVLLPEHKLHESVALAAFHTQQLCDAVGAAPIEAAYQIRHKLQGKSVVLYMSNGMVAPDELEEAFTLSSFLTGMPE